MTAFNQHRRVGDEYSCHEDVTGSSALHCHRAELLLPLAILGRKPEFCILDRRADVDIAKGSGNKGLFVAQYIRTRTFILSYPANMLTYSMQKTCNPAHVAPETGAGFARHA